jgi:SAM-dependent methyltransferase
MDALLATCERDPVSTLVLESVAPGSRVLEAGCGPGRYVKYLTDRGFSATGIEISPETVAMALGVWPECDIRVGDATAMEFGDGAFDAVLSLGVVEHFPDGPAAPLLEIARVLRPGGIAVITVPCLNRIRRAKRALWFDEICGVRIIAAALVKRRPQPVSRLRAGYKYAVYPACGTFFEYRMTTDEFAREVDSAGLRVVDQQPIGLMDGVFHEMNPWQRVVGFADWAFEPTRFATWLNEFLGRWPYLHPHMQVIVAVKPE